MTRKNPDPDWIEGAVTDEWDAIERQVGPELMPDLDPDKGWLGGGAYGSVYRTADPDVVVKVTHDVDEVSFVLAALHIGEWPAGIARYYDVYQLGRTFTDDAEVLPVYMLWRERADDPDDELLEEITKEVEPYMELSIILRGYAYDITRARREQMLDQAETMDLWAKVSGVFAGGIGRHLRQRTRRPTVETLGVLYLATLMRFRSLEPPLKQVGEALAFYLERGILISDANEDNLGEVWRDGRRVLAIRDPGVSVFFTTAYDPVIAPVGRLVANPQRLKRRLLQ